jgi:orotidine-5'-phosphate decarboxylase
VKKAGDLGVRFLTLHVQQRETLRRAVKAAEPFGIQLLAVTVLTSMTERDCEDMRYNTPTCKPLARTAYLGKLASDEGITGFVASVQEVATLRATHPKAVLVTPGIRPVGTDANDQRRTGTPREAIDAGASYIVVGRPIRDAQDPVAAAKAIALEMSQPAPSRTPFRR